MTAVEREYRVRIAHAGADVVEGNVAITLGLADLARIPTVTSQIPDILAGSTESRPWNVHVIDPTGAFAAAITAGGRWAFGGRLLDVGYRNLPAGEWVTYGTGRMTSADEEEGPGLYRIEVSDEGWRARKARIFEHADTTQLWPAGVKKGWRAIIQNGTAGAAAALATGQRVSSGPTMHRLRLTASGSVGGVTGRHITEKLIRWIEADAYGQAVDPATPWRQFRHLRLNYAGVDYEVVSFGADAGGIDKRLQSLHEPQVSVSNGREFISIHAWVYSLAQPPANGAAYLHAPTAPPSRDLPLHLGMDDPSHAWGTAGGWLHPASAAGRIFELGNAGVVLAGARQQNGRTFFEFMGSGFILAGSEPGVVVTTRHALLKAAARAAEDPCDLVVISPATQAVAAVSEVFLATHGPDLGACYVDPAQLGPEAALPPAPAQLRERVTLHAIEYERGVQASRIGGTVEHVTPEAIYIRMDAPVVDGMCGGPLVNGAGEAVGVLFAARPEDQRLIAALPLPAAAGPVGWAW